MHIQVTLQFSSMGWVCAGVAQMPSVYKQVSPPRQNECRLSGPCQQTCCVFNCSRLFVAHSLLPCENVVARPKGDCMQDRRKGRVSASHSRNLFSRNSVWTAADHSHSGSTKSDPALTVPLTSSTSCGYPNPIVTPSPEPSGKG